MSINIFNRREILITSDLTRFKEAKDALDNAGIDYRTGTRNLLSSSYAPDRRTRGMPGINHDYAYEYKIYVHKNDYEQALYVIRK